MAAPRGVPAGQMFRKRYNRFILHIPAQAVGVSKVFFDLWNGSDKDLVVDKVLAVKDGTVAVTGVIAIKLFAQRTTTIGTGGTAATAEGTDPTAPTISAADPSMYTLPTDNTLANAVAITARKAPGGGAALGAVVGEGQLFTEETAQVNYDESRKIIDAKVVVPAGTGLAVVEDATGSPIGNIGFIVVFKERT